MPHAMSLSQSLLVITYPEDLTWGYSLRQREVCSAHCSSHLWSCLCQQHMHIHCWILLTAMLCTGGWPDCWKTCAKVLSWEPKRMLKCPLAWQNALNCPLGWLKHVKLLSWVAKVPCWVAKTRTKVPSWEPKCVLKCPLGSKNTR